MQSHRDIIRRATGVEAREKKRRADLAWVCVFIIFVVVAAFLVYYPGFRIKQIEIVGAETLSGDQITALTNKELSGFHFLIIPRANFLFYPRREIFSTLRQTLPSIKTIRLSTVGREVLRLSIEERKSGFLWCRSSNVDESIDAPKDCFFMDDQGFVYSSAPAFFGRAFDEIYVPFSGDPVGRKYLTKDQLFSIRQTTDNLSRVVGSSVLASSTLERAYYTDKDYLTYRFYDKGLNNRYKIFVPLSASSSEELINFASALNSDIFKKNLKQAKGSVEYIDLRYGRKIFYRFFSPIK